MDGWVGLVARGGFGVPTGGFVAGEVFGQVNGSSTPVAGEFSTGAFVPPAVGSFGATMTTGFGSRLGKRDKVRDVCTGTSQKQITRISGHDAQESALVEIGREHIDHNSHRICALDISEGGFMTDVIAKTIVPEIQSLVSLDLWDSQIGYEGLESLMITIVRSTTLTSLDLGGNPLGDEGATMLADVLKSNTSLTHLGIFSRDMEVSGLNTFVRGLEVNTKILCLPHFVPRLKTKPGDVTTSTGSMTVKELRTELDAWGLDTDGLRKVHILYHGGS